MQARANLEEPTTYMIILTPKCRIGTVLNKPSRTNKEIKMTSRTYINKSVVSLD